MQLLILLQNGLYFDYFNIDATAALYKFMQICIQIQLVLESKRETTLSNGVHIRDLVLWLVASCFSLNGLNGLFVARIIRIGLYVDVGDIN